MPITHHPPSVSSQNSQKLSTTQQSPPPTRSETKDTGKEQPRETSQSVLTSSTPTLSHVDRHTPVSVSTTDFIRHPPPPGAFRPPPEFPPFFTNGNGMFRPGFPGYQHPAHHHPPVLHSPASLQNGELFTSKFFVIYNFERERERAGWSVESEGDRGREGGRDCGYQRVGKEWGWSVSYLNLKLHSSS